MLVLKCIYQTAGEKKNQIARNVLKSDSNHYLFTQWTHHITWIINSLTWANRHRRFRCTTQWWIRIYIYTHQINTWFSHIIQCTNISLKQIRVLMPCSIWKISGINLFIHILPTCFVNNFASLTDFCWRLHSSLNLKAIQSCVTICNIINQSCIYVSFLWFWKRQQTEITCTRGTLKRFLHDGHRVWEYQSGVCNIASLS